ncbi:NAD(P)H dehydrogenase (quinone) FQR1, partial [Ananas comosus]
SRRRSNARSAKNPSFLLRFRLISLVFANPGRPPLMAATKVYIVYYSMYGHVEKLAEEIKKGASSVEGVEAKLWQVPETLPEEVLAKMNAPPKSDVPIISPNELAEADGIIFGFPTSLTAITQLTHHGMIFVPVGYTFGAGMFEMEQLKGGSPYGAGTYAGDGSRLPSELELAQAFHQGKYFAGIAKKLKGSS